MGNFCAHYICTNTVHTLPVYKTNYRFFTQSAKYNIMSIMTNIETRHGQTDRSLFEPVV